MTPVLTTTTTASSQPGRARIAHLLAAVGFTHKDSESLRALAAFIAGQSVELANELLPGMPRIGGQPVFGHDLVAGWMDGLLHGPHDEAFFAARAARAQEKAKGGVARDSLLAAIGLAEAALGELSARFFHASAETTRAIERVLDMERRLAHRAFEEEEGEIEAQPNKR